MIAETDALVVVAEPEIDAVSLRAIASELGMDRSHARRWMLRHGFRPVKRRTPDSGGMLTLTLTRDEADRLVAMRREQGYAGDRPGPAVGDEVGVFYAIQLNPTHSPDWIKFGFAASVAERLAQHRTAAPTAEVLMTWPCRRSWEQSIMAAATSVGCSLVLNEVYEVASIKATLNRIDEVFAYFPSPEFRPPLSAHSPLAKEQPR